MAVVPVARVDRERILSKIDELDAYLSELKEISPDSFEEYQGIIEKKRACERLLQVSIEAVIDVCNLLVSGLRLGLPGEEGDLFEKLAGSGLISVEMRNTLREMKGFRNILVYEYARVDDRLVYEAIKRKLRDFESFKRVILEFLRGEG